MMKIIPVDFANADEDGSVRLVTAQTVEYCKSQRIVLSEGLLVRMSDGEIIAEGIVSMRDGFWVATINTWADINEAPWS